MAHWDPEGFAAIAIVATRGAMVRAQFRLAMFRTRWIRRFQLHFAALHHVRPSVPPTGLRAQLIDLLNAPRVANRELLQISSFVVKFRARCISDTQCIRRARDHTRAPIHWMEH